MGVGEDLKQTGVSFGHRSGVGTYVSCAPLVRDGPKSCLLPTYPPDIRPDILVLPKDNTRRESGGDMEWLGVWTCISLGSELCIFGAEEIYVFLSSP